MKKAIDLLEQALELLSHILMEAGLNQRRDVAACIAKAIAELETSRWETPEQYEARTGKKWPDNAAVYYRVRHMPAIWSVWVVSRYADARKCRGKPQMVVATEAGPPPDGWKPEEEAS
jgi:hypothetical protein